MANNIIIWSNSGRLWNIRGWLGHVTVRMCRWVVREKDKGVGKSKFAGIAINCYLQGCSFSEPRWIFAFQRTCNPCCRILDLSAAVKRIWMGGFFSFTDSVGASAHHITDTLSFKMSGTNTGYVKPPPKVIHHFWSSLFKNVISTHSNFQTHQPSPTPRPQCNVKETMEIRFQRRK